MNEGILLVLVGLIGLGVGFAIGLAVGVLRSSSGSPAQAPLDAPASESAPVESASPVEPPVPQAAAEAEPEPALTAPEALPLTPVQKRPVISPINVIARAIQSDVPIPHQADRSIAVQVDEILQEMLKTSPLANRAIRLMELPQKGMVVMIGLDQYDGLEAVPDEEVRQLLRAAVAEWEKRVSGQEK